MTRPTKHESKGQVLALFALFLVVLIGATAVTVDYGTWLKSRRDYQNVADAAVLAGSGFLSRPVDSTKREQARRAAWNSLNAQLSLGLTATQIDGATPGTGLDDSNTLAGSPQTFSNGYRVWVSTPPIGASTKYPGIFIGDQARYLFAWVEKDNPSFFSHIFGQGDRVVSAWATAGVFAGQFAVITLRKNGEDGPSNATDIDLAGTNTILQVNNGDVGGNWGMKLNSGSNLYLTGDAEAYLVDYVSCGNSCWSANQVTDGSLNLKTVQQLPNLIDDPMYPLPAVFPSLPPVGPVPPGIPTGSGTGLAPGEGPGDLGITKGAKSGTGCNTTTSPRIGPGWYDELAVGNGACLILDPLHNYSDPNDANNDLDFGQTDLPASQQPGIFYVTGQLLVNNDALVVGDGVTLVLRKSGNQPTLKVNGGGGGAGGGAVDINTGASDGTAGFPPDLRKAAFQSNGAYSYTFNTTTNLWAYSANNNDKEAVGIAVYVVKPAQTGDLTADANTDLVQINAGAALAWHGVLYAPRDNIQLSGQPLHNAIGQFICWTVKIAGGATIVQTYDGPGETAPRLVEPRLGQ